MQGCESHYPLVPGAEGWHGVSQIVITPEIRLDMRIDLPKVIVPLVKLELPA